MLPSLSLLLSLSSTARADGGEAAQPVPENAAGIEADKRGAQSERHMRPGRDGGRHTPADDEPQDEEGRRARMRQRLHPVGLLQLWGTAYDQDTNVQADPTGYGDPEDDPGVAVKRLRLGVAGEEKGLSYRLTVGMTKKYDGFDTEDQSLKLVDATVGYERKGVGIEVGQSEVPFSRDLMMSSEELTFTERGFGAEHVAPDRSLGGTIHAGRFGAKLTLGVFNAGGDVFGDDVAGKTLVGRLEYETGGDSYVTFGPAKGFVFGVGGGVFHTDDLATERLGYGGDLLVRYAGVYLLADVAAETITPTDKDTIQPDVWDPTHRLAVTGQLGCAIGDFEPSIRYSSFIDSSLGDDGQDYGQGMAGVVWHTAYDERDRDRVRVGAGYVLRLEQTPVKNDTVRLWVQLRP